MEQNTYQDNNVHQLYPGGTVGSTDRIDTIRDREGWGVMMERLSTDMTNLWDRQSRLISTEINEKFTTIKAASVSLVAGGVILFVAAIVLAIGASDLLDNFMPDWVARMVVGGVLLLIGFVMVKGAQKKLAGRGLVPEQSIDAMKQIKTTFQERIHEFKRQ